MAGGFESIQQKIEAFKRRYYFDLFIRGLILTSTILFLYFLLVVLLVYAFWLSPAYRLSIFTSFFLIAFYCIYRFLKGPIQFWITHKGIGNEQSARLIGKSFPTIKDKLLNFIQLVGLAKSS